MLTEVNDAVLGTDKCHCIPACVTLLIAANPHFS